MNIQTIKFDSIDSTNSEALREARLGADEGLCIMARHQTAGRGRMGRQWVSEKDAGLYFSIVLRPSIEMRLLPLVTLMAGVAVHDTLSEFGIDADIKWVNDLLVDDRKIGGILAETAETPKGPAVVVGIGLNLRSANYAPDMTNIATSIEAETGREATADQVASVLIAKLQRYYEVLHKGDGPAAIRSEWAARSSYHSGKSVSVNLGNEVFSGVTDGIEESGALRVLLADGTLRIIQAGDIHRVRAGSVPGDAPD